MIGTLGMIRSAVQRPTVNGMGVSNERFFQPGQGERWRDVVEQEVTRLCLQQVADAILVVAHSRARFRMVLML